MISTDISQQGKVSEAERHLRALDDANTTLGLELKEVHECLTIYRVVAINTKKIQGIGAQFLKYWPSYEESNIDGSPLTRKMRAIERSSKSSCILLKGNQHGRRSNNPERRAKVHDMP